MTTAETSVAIILVLVGVGAFFGIVLALADKKFYMQQNPLIDEVEDILPKGQCGACGFAGCAKYAEAVVENPDVPPNLCVPGKAAVAAKVAELTGKSAGAVEERKAHVLCQGGCNAKQAARYEGIHDCAAAKLAAGGPKACKYGCLGYGSCVAACPFDALHMGEKGLPVVDTYACTGCGKCQETCPQGVMTLLPVSAMTAVHCQSHDKGPAAKKACPNACLGCGLCMRNCPHGAIKIVNFLAVVDPAVCKASGCTEKTCLAKCPTGAIREAVETEKAMDAVAS